MRNKGLFRLLGVCLVLILAALPFMSACAKPTPAPAPAPAPTPPPKAIVLKAVTFVPVSATTVIDAFGVLLKRVNERAKGELIIEICGGPEVIGPFEQAMAVKKGAVDMAFLPLSFYEALVPSLHSLSQLMPWEERECGAFDIVAEAHKKVGLYYLGRGMPYNPQKGVHAIHTNKRVETPYELKGQKIATRGIMLDFLPEVGCIPVTTSEFYTGMERGVVDGYILPPMSLVDRQLEEVTKYRIDHPVFGGDLVNIINMDTWNGIPKHLQDMMIEEQIKFEGEQIPLNEKMFDRMLQKMQDAGMEFIHFSPADAKWYKETIYRVEWARKERMAPELTAKLKELTSRPIK